MLDEAGLHLKEAVTLGRTDILKTLLSEVKNTLRSSGQLSDFQVNEKFEEFVNTLGEDGETLLHTAAKLGKRDVVRALLQEGADPSIQCGSGDQQLCTSYEALKQLPQEEWDKLDQVFNEALFQATASSNLKLLKQLVCAGIPLSVVDSSATQNTALHWAASFGASNEVIQLFVEGGADVNAVNSDGVTPLHEAAYVKAMDVIQMLQKNGSKDDIVATRGKFKGKSARDLMDGFSTRILNGSLDENGVQDANGTNEADDSPESTSQSTVNCEVSHPTSTALALLPPPVIMDERFNLLWPQPKHLRQLPGDVCWFPPHLMLTIAPSSESIHQILDVWNSHARMLATVGRKVHLSFDSPRGLRATNSDGSDEATKTHIRCCVSRSNASASGAYKLTVNRGRVTVTCGDLSGLHNAVVTLVQLFRLFFNKQDPEDDELAAIVPVQISDFPDSPLRATLLDLNPYGRIPKMEVLFGLVDSLSALKINQLHTFFRLSLKEDQSFMCYGKSELLSLDRHCKDLMMEMVPAIDVDATVTCPDQLRLLNANMRQVLSCFDRPKFIHLGPAITSLVTAALDTGGGGGFDSLIPCDNVQDTTWIFCANSYQGSMSPAVDVPLNSVALQYGFKADEHFGSMLGDFVDQGYHVGTCTGTCSWSTLSGATDMAVSNGQSAARASHRLGPVTLSVTSHWSSHPSLGHLTFALPGFLVGAGHSWNSSTPKTYVDTVLTDLIDAHLLAEWANVPPPGDEPRSSVGKVLVELGKAESRLSSSNPASSVLLSVLSHPEDLMTQLQSTSSDVNDWSDAIKRIKRCQSTLLKCPTPLSAKAENHRHEVFLSSELMLLAARLGRTMLVESCGSVTDLPSTFRTDVANKLLGLSEQFRALWLNRSETSGLQGALQVFTNLINMLIPGKAELLTGQPL